MAFTGQSMAGDRHGTGTCPRSHHRAGGCSPLTSQAAFPSLHAHWLQQLGGPGLAGTRPPTQVGPARGLILRHLEKLAGLGFRLPHFAARSLGRPTLCLRWRSQPRSSAFSGAWHLARAGYRFLGTHQLVL